uniref:VWFA domain-containing protein n=1 Tax=Electrophorus electricus TaxID=8005 RepID=A0A4W4HLQ2_ELEEL
FRLSSRIMSKMLAGLLLFLCALGPTTGIRLVGNGYTDILVAINPAVPENDDLINRIKEIITSVSEYLFQALDNKVFFKEVKILVPPNWTNGTYERASTETYSKVQNILHFVSVQSGSFGDDPYTKQTKNCAEEGDYIHFTPNFLLTDRLVDVYGPKGRVFVHEWAHLRWGVYDEYNNKKPFYNDNGIQPTRCTSEVTGKWYELNNGFTQSCHISAETGLPTEECEFFPDKLQNAKASIMYMQIIDSVRAFCQEDEHNRKAPNMQNEKCDNKATHTVIFQESVDKDALGTLLPLQARPPDPQIRVLSRGSRVVCLVLDVSGSKRIILQKQASMIFLNQIIEEQASVGIVTFSTDAAILSGLTLIDGQSSRDTLIAKLPSTAGGSTFICKGLLKGLEVTYNIQVLKQDNKDTVGDEIIFLTDGEATDSVQDCLQTATESGTVINTLALGSDADNVLKTMADKTGGMFITANEAILSNQLVDAFSSLTSSNGNPTKQKIQLESTGQIVSDWFNGTVPIDGTVGNRTTFTVIYEKSSPTVYFESPSSSVYNQKNATDTANTITLTVPGTAEVKLFNTHCITSTSQAMSLTVTSQAARDDVPPIMVMAQMNQLTNNGNKPMIVFAEVSQKYSPVLNTTVWAYLESDTGHSEKLQLLDNGAGADAFKDDGIYSRYFTKLKKGRYNLKVRVANSGALYIPGYIVDGDYTNPYQISSGSNVGSFTRTATGESFVVDVPVGVPLPNFPPNKITDLSAEIQEDIVLLNWTAPGEDLDQGTDGVTIFRLRNNFSSVNQFNISALLPQEAGSAERHSLVPNITIQNGTTLFFAVQSEDSGGLKSQVSNIAQATKFLPSPKNLKPPGISNPGLNLTASIISVCVVSIVACLIATVITWVVKCRKLTDP